MSVMTVISRKVGGLLWGLISLFKKVLCFLNLRRRRKNSGSILPMTANHISTDVPQSVPTMDTSQVELESWDSWGTTEEQQNSSLSANRSNSNKSHGYQSNHLHRNKKPEPEPEPDVDFFGDMQPEFRKPKKILIKKKEDNYSSQTGLSSRLAMSTEVPLTAGSELESWEENPGESAWAAEAEEDISWQAEATLKENRSRERERRQMEQLRKKQERERAVAASQKGQFSAVKLS